ncbi:PAS domain-containing hybrid sensor histidine kinase/response regulator [bacterium M00.F.Ca.ET.228.01.1.1]|uniref:hybrid sensor histidine kinase/response regulator n=1 Tax=Paraburkholderia phenoliruptrix TaxID=252970 RepID=UPI0010931209|nr:hybrid sensor histidine kinase/response regulator [Paraburkholderia phenoliruptrix]TGP42441.1 PAS domain-containing hybrid sensor histidine kinase/response regulator [bacterium M00.F.Ca.ET.228.01.1.1]TGS00092.1 PAS domain-containing hybrid sensor histidine kinase/response regulator [bacterium M00.F.Ca.ET.191.01.1.1]TGU04412.1 PAS domain-containing hybrid sensor histidine kinase/response regulator [bacterium M00.F.Ca.ET.155.01.1.1]MBW0449919.1 response regulator [Paraburkholderia phenoliruptr
MRDMYTHPPDYGAAYDIAPCGLFTTVPGGVIVRANQTLCRWLGFHASALVGHKRFQDLITVGGRIFLQTHLAPLLDLQRSVAEVKLDMLRGDGTIVPVLVNISRVGRPGEQFDEFAVMTVSDRHKYERELLEARRRAENALQAKDAAEQALRVADRRKDEFLATLAHELRDPLGAMRTAVEVLMRDTQVAAAHKPGGSERPGIGNALDILERQLGKAARLTDDLLDISRIAQGKIEIRRAPVHLQAILDDVVVSARARLPSHDPTHTLEVDLIPEPVIVDADAVRIAQIVQNLLNNALRYTPSGGWVRLTAAREDGHAVIRVSDNGIGIAPDDLTRVFAMFGQAPAARGQGGLGIGLALVRALAELHGGTVTASSAGHGLGSTFEVRLPLAACQVLSSPPARAPRVETAGRRVVIADDNEDAAQGLAALLEEEGHVTAVAADGVSALRLVDEFCPEVVVLDIGLPDISGEEVASRIRRTHGERVSLVALTGLGAQTRPHALFDVFLTKPAPIDALLAAIAGTHDG